MDLIAEIASGTDGPRLQRCKQLFNFHILFIPVKTFDLFGGHAIGTLQFRIPLPS